MASLLHCSGAPVMLSNWSFWFTPPSESADGCVRPLQSWNSSRHHWTQCPFTMTQAFTGPYSSRKPK
ncbi:unnamed protein product, partial [Symbiodinium pilosum]